QRRDRLRRRRAAARGRPGSVASMMRGGGGAFDVSRELGRSWPDVQAGTKYDGSPVLTCRGCFMAGVAMHASAEPDTLVVRIDADARPRVVAAASGRYTPA